MGVSVYVILLPPEAREKASLGARQLRPVSTATAGGWTARRGMQVGARRRARQMASLRTALPSTQSLRSREHVSWQSSQSRPDPSGSCPGDARPACASGSLRTGGLRAAQTPSIRSVTAAAPRILLQIESQLRKLSVLISTMCQPAPSPSTVPGRRDAARPRGGAQAGWAVWGRACTVWGSEVAEGRFPPPSGLWVGRGAPGGG